MHCTLMLVTVADVNT